MSAQAFVEDLRHSIRRYSTTRHKTPVVLLTLVSGESHYVMSADAGEQDVLVLLDVYPEEMRGLQSLLEVETFHEGGGREVSH